MIGVLYVPPTAPRLLMVNVPPRSSSMRELGRAGPCGQRGQLLGDLQNAQPIGVAHHRHDQAAGRIDRHAEIDVLLVDDLLFLFVEARVEQRMLPQRQGHRPDDKRQRRQLDRRAEIAGGIVLRSRSRSVTSASSKLVTCGMVAGRLDHLRGDGAADLRHPLAADRPVGVFARLAGRNGRLAAARWPLRGGSHWSRLGRLSRGRERLRA